MTDTTTDPTTTADDQTHSSTSTDTGTSTTSTSTASTPTAAPATGMGAQLPTPIPGRIVMVRVPGHQDAPGIVVEVDAKTERVTCQIFRADHAVHSASNLTEITVATSPRGWYWPGRR